MSVLATAAAFVLLGSLALMVLEPFLTDQPRRRR